MAEGSTGAGEAIWSDDGRKGAAAATDLEEADCCGSGRARSAPLRVCMAELGPEALPTCAEYNGGGLEAGGGTELLEQG